MLINLINGDCLEEMKTFKDESIDFILCDPPYGTTACPWDTIIPFDLLWLQYERIIKPNGVIALFGKEPFSSYVRLSNLQLFKYDWTWIKSRKNGYVHAKGMPLQQTENISIFSKGSIRRRDPNPMNYYPQGLIEFEKKRINYVKHSSAYGGGHEIGTEYKQEGANYPTNLIYFKNESPKTQVHPTQKPIDLLEYLIKTYTVENDTVLDNCMGSGSTGVAAKNLQRSFIGIEQDLTYFNIAKDRIEETTLSDFT
jgi:site-specific DNA-methyltransferase (adenine-specific)